MSQALLEQPAPPARPALRLVPVPSLDPPALDGCPAPVAFQQEQLPLLYLLPGGLPAEPQPRPELLARPEPRGHLGGDEFFDAQPAHTADLPDPVRWTLRLVQGVVDVLSGERPAHQLTRWLTPDVHAAVLAHSVRTNGVGVDVRRQRVRRRVGSVHVCQPADGVVEATAVVVGSRRARAMALRLEGLDGRWRCTALEVG